MPCTNVRLESFERLSEQQLLDRFSYVRSDLALTSEHLKLVSFCLNKFSTSFPYKSQSVESKSTSFYWQGFRASRE
jgi:hypothetical protein